MFAVLILFLFCSNLDAFEAEKHRYNKVNNDVAEADKMDKFSGGGRNPTPTPRVRGSKGDEVVERFVDTLLSSEKYLKMIETVERKLNHLDTTFHEKVNSILKYQSEILRSLKESPATIIENTMRALKTDMDGLRASVADIDLNQLKMRVENRDDTNLEARLSYIEGNMKNILDGVESIVNTISEVKSRQYSRLKAENTPQDMSTLLTEFRRVVSDQRKDMSCNHRVDRAERYPSDCYEIQLQGFNVSGIYKIKPDDMEPFYVLCELTSSGGGWTVFQNRYDGSQDFYKSWSDYKYGFGNMAGEFWLGLEKLHYLTNQKLYEVRVEMESQLGQEAFATYSVFTIAPEYEGFRISTLGTYLGTAGDSLSYHAGQKFSTYDVDNDEWKDGACTVEHGGAWWYKECDKSNLNGKYSLSPEEHRGQFIYWVSFKGPNTPLVKSRMMIRPLPASRPSDYSSSLRMASSVPSSSTQNKIDNKPPQHLDYAGSMSMHRKHADFSKARPGIEKPSRGEIVYPGRHAPHRYDEQGDYFPGHQY